MKKINLIFLPLLASMALVGCEPNSSESTSQNQSTSENVTSEIVDTVVIKDMLNRQVEIKKNPESFVCLGPGALRQYCYVGDTSKLVGIETIEQTAKVATRPYLSSIKNYKDLPIIGEGGPKDRTNKEALLAVNPDIVFTSYVSDSANLDLLAKQTGLAVVAVGYNSNGLFADDIYQSLLMMSNIIGNPSRGEEVVQYFKDSKLELAKAAEDDPIDKTAYLGCVNHRGSHGIDYTTGDFPVFDVLGVKNAVHSENITNFAQIDKEAIVKMNPDVIIIDAGGLKILREDMATHANFYSSLTAFKNQEVYLTLPTVSYSCNFDVALANAYYLGKVFHPEQFKNVNIEEKFNEITNFLLGVETYNDTITHYGAEYGKLDYTL